MPPSKERETMTECLQDCVIYARYSSHNQRDASIEQQVEECEAYARYNGLRVVKVYADRHLSGTTDQRPQFQQMLKDAAHGRWSVVLTWKVDRFARNRYDSATYKYRLKRHGVRVVYAKESIPDGTEGILLESILEGSAEYYSANLAQNVKRGLRFNAEACLSNGRIPYGYCKGPDGHFAVLESEAAIVREIFSRYAAGETKASIVADMKKRGGKVIPISVNVSRKDLFKEDFLDVLKTYISEYDLEARLLHLEITESTFGYEPEVLSEIVVELKKCGFVIEMDDFGSGYSSLNALSKLPIDMLKLDMMFMDTEDLTSERSLLKFVIDLAKYLKLPVISEGVETKEQVDALRKLGCDMVQGYYFSKPIPAAKFIEELDGK